MPLRLGNGTVRIDLTTPGEWIEVYETLGRDGEREVSRKLLNLRQVPASPVDGVPMVDEYDLGDLTDFVAFARLEVAIRRWSFDMLITPRSLRGLEDEDMALIHARLDELYPARRSEEATKN